MRKKDGILERKLFADVKKIIYHQYGLFMSGHLFLDTSVMMEKFPLKRYGSSSAQTSPSYQSVNKKVNNQFI